MPPGQLIGGSGGADARPVNIVAFICFVGPSRLRFAQTVEVWFRARASEKG